MTSTSSSARRACSGRSQRSDRSASSSSTSGRGVEPGGLLEGDQRLAEAAESGLLHLGQLAEAGRGQPWSAWVSATRARAASAAARPGMSARRRWSAQSSPQAQEIFRLDLQHLGQRAGGDLEVRGQVLGRDGETAEELRPVGAVARQLGEGRQAADEQRTVAPRLAEGDQPLERDPVARVCVDGAGEEAPRPSPARRAGSRYSSPASARKAARRSGSGNGGRGALERPGERRGVPGGAPGRHERLERLRVVGHQGERGLPVLAGLDLVAEARGGQRGQGVVGGVRGARGRRRRCGEGPASSTRLLVAGDRLRQRGPAPRRRGPAAKSGSGSPGSSDTASR